MNKEKIEHYAHLAIVVLAAGILTGFFIKYVFAIAFPFLLAWGIAFILRPVANKIYQHTHIPQGIVRVILALLSFALLIGCCVLFTSLVVTEVGRILSGLLEGGVIDDLLLRLTNPLENILPEGEWGALWERIEDAIFSFVNNILSSLTGFVSGFIGDIPRVFLVIVVTVISIIYFALDLERINQGVCAHLPQRICNAMRKFKQRFLYIGIKYVKAYLIMMAIMFVILFVGFLILKVEYALSVALIAALLDALPIIGVGVVLVPWSIFSFISGDLRMGIGLLILMAVAVILRELLEPRVVGRHLGIHPVISLILIYVSFSCFGFFGLLLLPLFVVLFKTVVDKDDFSKIKKSRGA